MTRRVLLVDDHAVVRNGLRTVLEASRKATVTGEAATARDGIRLALGGEFDVVVFDLSLPDMSGIEAMKLIHAQRPRLAVVMFSMHAEREYCLRALRAGALGYVTKQGAPEEIIQAVDAAANGRRWVSPSIAEQLIGAALTPDDGRPPHELLSDREFEVFRLIAAGETPTQIAKRLCLSVKTVSSHRARLLEKLHLENNLQIIKYAVEHGLSG